MDTRARIARMLTAVMDRAANFMSAGELYRNRRTAQRHQGEKRRLEQQLEESRRREETTRLENRKLQEKLAQNKIKEAQEAVQEALDRLRNARKRKGNQ